MSQPLSFVGPIDSAHGYPLWYEDPAGVRLELGLGNDPLTPAGEQPPDPAAPLAIPGNFPEEAFYYYAECEVPVGGAGVVGRARLILALEAAFGGPGTPADGARVVFVRTRVRMDDVLPGATYTVTHPWGVAVTEADERGRVFWTDDKGIADQDFHGVLPHLDAAPFLSHTVDVPPGYLGDGATPRPVTGSPHGTNHFRIEGPGVADAGGPVDPADPTNPDVVLGVLFTVQGRRARRAGVQITRAGYTRDAAGAVVLDVFARSVPVEQNQHPLELTTPRVAATGRDRDYVAHATATSVPVTVTVVNPNDTPPTHATAPVTDLVDITRADLDQAAGTLTVDATSSDAAAPTLTVTGFGPLTAHPTVYPATAAPDTLEVTSAAGGRGTRRVTVTGPTGTALPLLADAGPDLTVPTGTVVTLDGTGSRGTITAHAWTQTTGTPVALDDPAGATTTFTAPPPAGPVVAEQLGFELAVTGEGAATDTVTVTVTGPPPADVLTVQATQFRTGRRQWRVGGALTSPDGPRPNRVTVSLLSRTGPIEIGSAPVDVTGAWDVRRTLASADDALIPTPGARVRATSQHDGTDEAAVNIRN